MRILYLSICIFFLFSCGSKTANFNILKEHKAPDVVTEFLVLDTVNLLKLIKPPAAGKIVIEANDDKDKYLYLLINRLRGSGYSVIEIESHQGYEGFILSYIVDIVYESDNEIEFKRRNNDMSYIMSLTLDIERIKYTRIYAIDGSEIKTLGGWSKYEVVDEQ